MIEVKEDKNKIKKYQKGGTKDFEDMILTEDKRQIKPYVGGMLGFVSILWLALF